MKRKVDNIAEYILYLWQVEDYLRAFPNEAGGSEELEAILVMMREEGIMDSGHLQLAKNALEEMEDLHQEIIRQEVTYCTAFKRLQPSLITYKAMTATPGMTDIEACFVFLYNIHLMRLQRKEIGQAMRRVQEEISSILRYLSKTYRANYWSDENERTV